MFSKAMRSSLCWRILDCARWGPLALAGAALLDVSFIVVRYRVLRGDFGKLEVILALVALMKLELATFKIDVGKARSILCEYGTALAGTGSLCEPILDSWEGGIQGASR